MACVTWTCVTWTCPEMASTDVSAPPNHSFDTISSRGLTLLHSEFRLGDLRLSFICVHSCGRVSIRPSVRPSFRPPPPCKSSPPAERCLRFSPRVLHPKRRPSLRGCRVQHRFGFELPCARPVLAGECTRAGATLSACGLQSLWRRSVRISTNHSTSIYTPRVQRVAVRSSLQQRALDHLILRLNGFSGS